MGAPQPRDSVIFYLKPDQLAIEKIGPSKQDISVTWKTSKGYGAAIYNGSYVTETLPSWKEPKKVYVFQDKVKICDEYGVSLVQRVAKDSGLGVSLENSNHELAFPSSVDVYVIDPDLNTGLAKSVPAAYDQKCHSVAKPPNGKRAFYRSFNKPSSSFFNEKSSVRPFVTKKLR